MRDYTFFDPATGRPTHVQSYRNAPDEEWCAMGHLLDRWRDEFGNLWLREPLQVTQDKLLCAPGESVTFSGLPEPCDLMVDKDSHTVEDGTLVIHCQTVGAYVIRINMTKYLPGKYTVICDGS